MIVCDVEFNVTCLWANVPCIYPPRSTRVYTCTHAPCFLQLHFNLDIISSL